MVGKSWVVKIPYLVDSGSLRLCQLVQTSKPLDLAVKDKTVAYLDNPS